MKMAALLLLLMLTGCDFPSPPAAQAKSTATVTPEAPKPCQADHRFVKSDIPGLNGSMALDSCTGQLCKTWAWVAVSPKSSAKQFEALSLCAELPNFHTGAYHYGSLAEMN
jgi:hypothetical protein